MLPGVGATRERPVRADRRRLVDPPDPATRSATRSRAPSWSAPRTGRSRGSRRSATPTPRAATSRSTSASNAWRSAATTERATRRCSRTSARSAAWVCGCNGAGRRTTPSRCWSPSRRSRRRSGSAGCSGSSTFRRALGGARLPGDRRRRRVAVRRSVVPGERGTVAADRRGGRSAVEPAPDARVEALPVGILSSLFTGFLTCRTPSGWATCAATTPRSRRSAAVGRTRSLVPVLLLREPGIER